MTDTDLFAAIVADAKLRVGMTAAEFDLSLAARDGRALGGIYDACYAHANRIGTGDIEESRQRAIALHARLWPLTQQRIREASARSYTGWSLASGAEITPMLAAKDAKIDRLRAELAAVKANAIVLPEDWRNQVATGFGFREGGFDLEQDVVGLIESWRGQPDTEATKTEQAPDPTPVLDLTRDDEGPADTEQTGMACPYGSYECTTVDGRWYHGECKRAAKAQRRQSDAPAEQAPREPRVWRKGDRVVCAADTKQHYPGTITDFTSHGRPLVKWDHWHKVNAYAPDELTEVIENGPAVATRDAERRSRP